VSVTKAHLRIRFPPSTANGEPGAEISRIDLVFNPKELTVKRSAKYEAKATKKNNPPTYVGLEPGSISVEVFLDRELCEKVPRGVVGAVDQLFGCLEPVPKQQETNPSPPYVTFGWGSHTYLTGQVKSVTAKYTLFDTSGNPIRAVCTMEIQEARTGPAKTNPTSGGLQPRNAHRVAQGDSLQSIAYQEYGDPTLWRAVAAANGIDDPCRLRAGAVLLLPSADDARSMR
jgi:hypothetical protein